MLAIQMVVIMLKKNSTYMEKTEAKKSIMNQNIFLQT